MPSFEDLAKGTVAATAGLSTVAFGLLYYGQNYLIYPSAFPPGSRTEVPTPDQFGIPYHDLELRTEDDVKLRCYLLVQTKNLDLSRPSAHNAMPDDEFAATRPTIIMFHGNGGNLGHRIPLANVFFVKMRCNVLMVSYRGYGLSEGSPSEKGLRLDAQSALDYVKSHPTLSKGPTVLYGQSIGGAVSIDLASRNPLAIRALVLENTFLSLPRLVPTALPVLGPFAFLCHQKWDSASKIHLIPRKTPILMLSGARDEVIPREHMEGLWELITQREAGQHAGPSVNTATTRRRVASTPSAPANAASPASRVHDVTVGEAAQVGEIKLAAYDPRSLSKFVEFENGMHNDTCVQPGYWAAIAEFIGNLQAEIDAPSQV
ncbi:alpha/beta-hydrolase [Cristinia sonorae]|uniref:Alpha/beta-hydrolase n=1 Tax=Cristinia sonorae TaxID=1940300 RepID=A0A8K0UMN3_9AGAR|nr:alpha/beta-hydrolase [Cristinia sonorae]